jgi:hypothetical protein
MKKSLDQNEDTLEIVAKIMNIKDNLLSQVFVAMLYRKLVSKQFNFRSYGWTSISKQTILYIAVRLPCSLIEVVDCLQIVDELKERLNYVPAKMVYKDIALKQDGFYTYVKKMNFSQTSK